MTNADTDNAGCPADALADARLIAECVAAGRPIPAEVARRVRDEAARITARLRQEYGTLDIGVPAIRDLRGQLPR
jgi:hypothetical protein